MPFWVFWMPASEASGSCPLGSSSEMSTRQRPLLQGLGCWLGPCSFCCRPLGLLNPSPAFFFFRFCSACWQLGKRKPCHLRVSDVFSKLATLRQGYRRGALQKWVVSRLQQALQALPYQFPGQP